MQPFRYLTQRSAKSEVSNGGRRRHAPHGYEEFNAYKPWLRDEFAFRCAYCLYREVWTDFGHSNFGVDHAAAKSVDPDRECEYENLVYACNRCNTAKGTRKLPFDPLQDPIGEY